MKVIGLRLAVRDGDVRGCRSPGSAEIGVQILVAVGVDAGDESVRAGIDRIARNVDIPSIIRREDRTVANGGRD